MDCCSTNSSLLSLEQALEKLLSQSSAIAQTEQIPLAQAVGRITARPVISPLNVPPFDNSAMDGYAVRLADVTPDAVLPVAGKAFAGQPFQGEWPAGSCIRIMTGAPVPKGTEAVIMQEQAEVLENGVRFTHSPKAGQNVRLAGEDIRQDAEVLPAGSQPGRSSAANSGLSRYLSGRGLSPP